MPSDFIKIFFIREISHCVFPGLPRVIFKTTTTTNHTKLPKNSKATVKKRDLSFSIFFNGE